MQIEVLLDLAVNKVKQETSKRKGLNPSVRPTDVAVNFV
jgi:hypothetical protein